MNFSFLKINFVFGVLAITLNSFSQNCELIDSVNINCVDSNGLKQGFWIQFDTINLIKVRRSHPDKGGSRVVQMDRIKIAEGKYLNNEKIGKWKIEAMNNWEILQKEKTIEYLYNGDKIIEVLDSNYKSKILMNNDSSFVDGYFIYSNDTINVLCKADNCNLKINDKSFIQFYFDDFLDLEYQIDRLYLGVYDRKLKEALIKD